MATENYIGDELMLFEKAKNWKSYYYAMLKPFLQGKKVLEVGAGLGGTTVSLCDGSQSDWLCLEPDPQLFGEIEQKIQREKLPSCCRAFSGFLTDLNRKEKFDAILYMDVIEHIEDDHAELQTAVETLAQGGHLIILVPAHQWLYSPFDKAIGHFRRYNRKRLKNAIPKEGTTTCFVRYLDCVGLLASSANKLMLKQSYPTPQQISLWDNWMIPISQRLDPLSGFSLGKSVLGVWKKS